VCGVAVWLKVVHGGGRGGLHWLAAGALAHAVGGLIESSARRASLATYTGFSKNRKPRRTRYKLPPPEITVPD
jgi:hypothetical protein